MNTFNRFVLIISLCVFHCIHSFALPRGFSYLSEVAPSIKQHMMYATSDNFVGRRVVGYLTNQCILTTQAAEQLRKVQKHIHSKGLSLIVYDCYRPRKAVLDFVQYASSASETTKAKFYPSLKQKSDMFKKGYVAYQSGHSSGSTVDLAIIPAHASKYYVGCQAAPSGTEIDYGSGIDCFDRIVHTKAKGLPALAKRHRNYLVQTMSRYGFRNYPKEWWHYTLRNEPFRNRQFDFDIKN